MTDVAVGFVLYLFSPTLMGFVTISITKFLAAFSVHYQKPASGVT